MKKTVAINRDNIPCNIPIFGDPDYRTQHCALEAQEQSAFFEQIRAQYPDSWGLLATSIQNEAGKDVAVRTAIAKKAGLVTGAPDIIIPGRMTFLCELKRKDRTKSRIGTAQLDYLLAAQKAGAFVCIALGSEAAWKAFQYWREGSQ